MLSPLRDMRFIHPEEVPALFLSAPPTGAKPVAPRVSAASVDLLAASVCGRRKNPWRRINGLRRLNVAVKCPAAKPAAKTSANNPTGEMVWLVASVLQSHFTEPAPI